MGFFGRSDESIEVMFQEKRIVTRGSEKVKNPIAPDQTQIHRMDGGSLGWNYFPVGKAEWFHLTRNWYSKLASKTVFLHLMISDLNI